MDRHQLDPSPSTTVDVFSRDLPPVLTVDPGDTIVLRSLDASGHLQPQTFPGEKVPTMFSERRGHCLTGPIAVAVRCPARCLRCAYFPAARHLGLHRRRGPRHPADQAARPGRGPAGLAALAD